jgi:hypothetical protein
MMLFGGKHMCVPLSGFHLTAVRMLGNYVNHGGGEVITNWVVSGTFQSTFNCSNGRSMW